MVSVAFSWDVFSYPCLCRFSLGYVQLSLPTNHFLFRPKRRIGSAVVVPFFWIYLWSIYCWCIYCLQDTDDRWRQLWRAKHCSTSIWKPIFSLLIQMYLGTNLQSRSISKTTGKKFFGCNVADMWETESWETKEAPEMGELVRNA